MTGRIIKMSAKKNIVTQEGYQKLLDEFEDLKNVRRPANLQKLKEAKEQGDLSENAEYDAAREEQREIEGRLAELDELIKNVEIVNTEDVDKSLVHIGCSVRVLDMEFDEEVVYKLVGSTEVDVMNNIISYECPVGAALKDHKAGEIVDVYVEDSGYHGQYKILEIIPSKA